MADAVPFCLMLLLAIASAGILEIRRSLRLSLLIGSASFLAVAAALLPWQVQSQAAAVPWIALAIGGVTAAIAMRPAWICAVVGPAALAASRAVQDGPAMAAWIAALHLFAVTGLAGTALGGFSIVSAVAPQAMPQQPSRWMTRITATLLLVLTLAAVAALLVAGEPLGLLPGVALLVLPAETVAGLCVWRGWERIARAAADDEPTRWATWAGVLAVFALAGVGLAIVPVILWAGVH